MKYIKYLMSLWRQSFDSDSILTDERLNSRGKNPIHRLMLLNSWNYPIGSQFLGFTVSWVSIAKVLVTVMGDF
jgi:hypothetical protein